MCVYMCTHISRRTKILKYRHTEYCKYCTRKQRANNKTSSLFLLPHFLHLPTGATTS